MFYRNEKSNYMMCKLGIYNKFKNKTLSIMKGSIKIYHSLDIGFKLMVSNCKLNTDILYITNVLPYICTYIAYI